MATDKRGGQGRHNGGLNPKAEGWNVGDQMREGAEAVSHRLHEGYDMAREGVGRGYRRVEGTIARNPAPSVLLGFGLGFGLGVALVSMFGRGEESWVDRHIPDRFRHMPDHLRDSVKHVPDHVHHLAEAIASHLPHAIKRHMG